MDAIEELSLQSLFADKQRRVLGLQEAIFRNVKKMRFRPPEPPPKGAPAPPAPEPCSICMLEFEARQPLIVLPCKHSFHDPCVREWFKHASTCPLCRFDVAHDVR